MMLNVFVIPAESYPSNHPFLEEVFSRKNIYFKSCFLMTSMENSKDFIVKWNDAKVYVLPKKTGNKLYDGIFLYIADFRYLKAICNIIKKEKIDIVQIRDLTFPLMVALFLRKKFNLKVFYQKSHPHELKKLDFSYLINFKFPVFAYIFRKTGNFILHKMMRYCNAIFPISHYMKQNLYREYCIPLKKMFPFGMGFNKENIAELKGKSVLVKSAVIKLIYIGTLAYARNLERMLDAVKITSSINRQNNLILTVIGGTEHEISRLKDYAVAIGINKIIDFKGRIKRSEVYKHVGSADIGISYCPRQKRFQDAWPTKLTEYLAMGIPCIATSCVDMHKDLIDKTGAGVVTDENPYNFAENLCYLIDNLDKYKDAGNRAAEYILNNYSYHKMQSKIHTIYQNF